MNTVSTKPEISFEEFLEIEKKLSIRIGTVVVAERIPKSNGIKLTVDFGDEVKTAFTNLGKTFEVPDFIGKSFPFITNLAPSVIKGVNSEVMIMVGENPSGQIFLTNYETGSKLM